MPPVYPERPDPAEYFKIPQFVSRAEWGAMRPRTRPKPKGPVIWMVFKDTDTRDCHSPEDCARVVREIQREDMEKHKLPDIRYNFLIGTEGTIFEGRGWDASPDPYPQNEHDLTKEVNRRSCLVGMIGEQEERRHSRKHEFSAIHLIGLGVEQKKIHEDLQYLMYFEVGFERDAYDSCA